MYIQLRSFINKLESLADKPSLDELKQCVLEMNGMNINIDEYISFSDTGYKRNTVYVSGKCEVTVLCFKEGQSTPIHDHGGSIGITIIRKGIMREELFVKQPSGMIIPTFTRKYFTGEKAYVTYTLIHRVSNIRTEGLVTINIYFPPLTLMNIYNTENTLVEKWVADYNSIKGLKV